MQIGEAKWENGWLMLKSADVDARHFAYQFQAGEYTIRKSSEKRSLDANSYCWVIIGKIASAVGLPKTEVYRRAIKEMGNNFTIACIQSEAVPALTKQWESNGIGWLTETMPSKLPNCTNVILYEGSHLYDRKQMSQLIDLLIQDAKALGIETMPPERLESLLRDWDA